MCNIKFAICKLYTWILENLNIRILKYLNTGMLGFVDFIRSMNFWIFLVIALSYPQAEFPRVHQYWAAIQARAGYQASRPDPALMAKLETVGRQIDSWKGEHSWFRDYYDKC